MPPTPATVAVLAFLLLRVTAGASPLGAPNDVDRRALGSGGACRSECRCFEYERHGAGLQARYMLVDLLPGEVGRWA
jgi:hypothetical protein